jgi:hypothetical protein
LERRARENQIDFVEGVATALLPVAFFEVVMTAFRTLVEDGTEVPPTRSASSPGWSDVLKLLVVVICGGQDRALPVAADGPRVRGDENARRRGLSSRRSPSLSSLTTTLPVMAQIDIEYAGRTYTVPWTDDNVERLKGIAQHVRDGRAEVFTVLGDGFALTIVVGPTIPVAITYVD